MGSIFYQGSGIKILGEKGLRDQNNGKKIGIGGSRIYHVTTLLSVPCRRRDAGTFIFWRGRGVARIGIGLTSDMIG